MGAQTLGFLGQLGQSAAGAIMGMGLGAINDQRQLKQQQKLGQQQLELNKAQMAYGKELDYQMWLKTNYSAQKEQMEKAGLNPGLLYGMGGSGGATTGGSGGSVNTPSAPMGGGEAMGMMMMKAQLDLMKAQTEATQAQANKSNVEANKLGGVDTKLSETQIESLTQGIANQQALEELTKIQARLSNLELNLKEDSYYDTLDNIRYTAAKINEEFQNIRYERILSGETLRTKISLAESELS